MTKEDEGRDKKVVVPPVAPAPPHARSTAGSPDAIIAGGRGGEGAAVPKKVVSMAAIPAVQQREKTSAIHRSRQPRKFSPSGLRARSILFAHFVEHRPLPGNPPVLWTSAPG